MVPHDPARNCSERSVACPGVHGSTFSPARSRTSTAHSRIRPKPTTNIAEIPGRPNDCSTKALIAADPESPGHLTESHERVGSAVLVLGQHVHRHAVDRDILCGAEAIQHEAQCGQRDEIV